VSATGFDLLATVGAFAAVDALNVSTVIGCAYLLSTPTPLRKAMAFVAGILSVYYTLGAVVVVGFGDRANRVIDTMKTGAVRTTTQVVIGCVLILLAIRRWRPAPHEAPRPRPTPAATIKGPAAAFAFGATATLLDAPTAFPYAGALGSIARARLPVVAELLVLGLYNLIYLAPCILLIIGWARSGDRGIAFVERLRSRLSRFFAHRRWSIALGVAGGALIASAAV
jgi:cytochrome c biogenesis protein CcdA